MFAFQKKVPLGYIEMVLVPFTIKSPEANCTLCTCKSLHNVCIFFIAC